MVSISIPVYTSSSCRESCNKLGKPSYRLTESNMKQLFSHFVLSSKMISSNSPLSHSKGLLISHQRWSLLLSNKGILSISAQLSCKIL